MKIENTKAQMRKGVLEYCILSILSNGDAYASDIIKELKEAAIIVVEGTLYPLLTRLKNAQIQQEEYQEVTDKEFLDFVQGIEITRSELDPTFFTAVVDVVTQAGTPFVIEEQIIFPEDRII